MYVEVGLYIICKTGGIISTDVYLIYGALSCPEKRTAI
jgi:hypothetical protein